MKPRRLIPLTLFVAATLSACSTAETDTPEPQFTRIDTATEEKTAPASSQEKREKDDTPSAPEKTYDGIVPRTDPDNENSEFSTDKRDVAAPGKDIVIMDLRAGSHDGFDRVVYEFAGDMAPSFATEWVDSPIAYATDNVLDVKGNAYLRLQIRDTTDDSGRGYSYDATAGNVLDVYHTASQPVLGATEYFIGLDRKRPYRIYYLKNPNRLVIDVAK